MIIFVLHCLSCVFQLAYSCRYSRRKLLSPLIADLLIAAFFMLVIFYTDLIEGIIVFMIYAAIILSGFLFPLLTMHRCLMGILGRRNIKNLKRLYSDIKSGNEDDIRKGVYDEFLDSFNAADYEFHDSQNPKLSRFVLAGFAVRNEIRNRIDAVRFDEKELNILQRLKNCF